MASGARGTPGTDDWPTDRFGRAFLESLTTISKKETPLRKIMLIHPQTDPSQTLAEALRQNQERPSETTSALIARLSQWEGKRGLQRELDELQKQQAALLEGIG